MKRGLLLLGLLALVITVTACGAVSSLTGGKGGTVSTMWPDVPVFEGATKSNIDLPLPMRLAIQGIVKASAQSNDTQLDKFDFIAYTTPKTPEDVAAFYTQERMAAAGWNQADQPGCAGAGGNTAGFAGGFCVFGKQDGDKGSALFIIAANDEKSQQTQLFYVRFDGIKKTGGQ